jgi:3-oxoacyl-[acyl-carrier protein] reductase
MGEFAEKIVLITGAGRGLGRAIAKAFAKEGAHIAANDIGPINLDETVATIQATGAKIRPYIFDIAKKLPVQALVEEVLDDWQRIDILINNAAVEPRASILQMDEWDWQRAIDVNLSGPFFLMQQVGRFMREQGGGVIVNIAAAEGRRSGLADRSAYLASKSGLLGLTREAAREFAAYHIRVNAVCPADLTGGSNQKSPIDLPAAQPNDTKSRSDSAVQLVLFLCSQKAAHIVGQSIHVDDGLFMM